MRPAVRERLPHARITSTASCPAARTRSAVAGSISPSRWACANSSSSRQCQLRSGCTEMSRKWSSESTPPAQRTSGCSRLTYQFLNRQPGSQNSHTDQGRPGWATFSTPVPNQRSRCTVRGLVYRDSSGSRCTGVPSASTGFTHSVPGASHTASSSASSRTTVTGRAMWKCSPPFSR